MTAENYLTKSGDMQKTYDIAAKIARLNDSVLILGETGVGKTHLARYIHACSERADQRIVEINCGHYNSSADVSSNAVEQAVIPSLNMLCEQARGSSILLNDIDYLSLSQQSKLVGILDLAEAQRPPQKASTDVDFRMIVTSNKDLRSLVANKAFLPDLLARINEWRIKVLPLRERKTCIRSLVESYLREFQSELATGSLHNGTWSFEDPLMDLFSDYDWPENIRELKAAVRNIVVLSEENQYPFKLKEAINILLDKNFGLFERQHSSMTHDPKFNTKQRLKKALELTRWNISRTSDIVGMSRTTIYKFIKEEGWQK